MTTDKRISPEEAAATVESGMTIGIGGWGSRRKPMALLRALLRTDVTDLTVVSFGGPDVGMLCAAGKVARTISAFVSPDVTVSVDPPASSPGLEPHYRRARQSGTIAESPLDEGMVLLGLQAAAWRVPFLPSRLGLGSDLFRDHPDLRTVTSPYDDGEQLVAVPALNLDAAFVHMNRGDARGNAQFLGPDPYFDDLILGAAARGRRFLSVEEVVPTADLTADATFHTLVISRDMVDGVIEAPNGAHPTSCEPAYDRDDAFQSAYFKSAKADGGWDEFWSTNLDFSEDDYQRRIREANAT